MNEINYIHDKQNEIISMIEKLVNIDSPSNEQVQMNAFSEYLSQIFINEGANIRFVDGGENGRHFVANFGGEHNGILILCHMDTVWPLGEAGKRPFRIEDGRAYGPGVYDMKSGIVQALYAVKMLKELRKDLLPVTFLCNSDEEIGSNTSRETIEELAKANKYVLVMEPSAGVNGAIKTFRKAQGTFKIKAYGRSAHSGIDFEKGISAIEEIAYKVLEMKKIMESSRGTTINVGIIRGGTKQNIVPPEAEIIVDVRVSECHEIDRLREHIYSMKTVLDGARIEISGDFTKPVMERTEQNLKLIGIAKKVAKEVGIELYEASVGSGSDGNFTSSLKVPTLDGLGAVGDNSHTPDEYILLSEIPKRTALVMRLMEEISRNQK